MGNDYIKAKKNTKARVSILSFPTHMTMVSNKASWLEGTQSVDIYQSILI